MKSEKRKRKEKKNRKKKEKDEFGSRKKKCIIVNYIILFDSKLLDRNDSRVCPFPYSLFE